MFVKFSGGRNIQFLEPCIHSERTEELPAECTPTIKFNIAHAAE